LFQPTGLTPPDITISVPAANGGGAGPSNSSHLADSESDAGGAGTAAAARDGGSAGLWPTFSSSFARGGAASAGSISGAVADGSSGGRGGFRAAARKLFSRGHDMEAAGVNHQYTREERAKLKQFQSIDYLAPSSRVYRHWLAAQPWGRYWDRWLMMALIGMAVGITGFFLHFSVNVLAAVKYHATRWVPGCC
jgi:chloride channel 7